MHNLFIKWFFFVYGTINQTRKFELFLILVFLFFFLLGFLDNSFCKHVEWFHRLPNFNIPKKKWFECLDWPSNRTRNFRSGSYIPLNNLNDCFFPVMESGSSQSSADFSLPTKYKEKILTNLDKGTVYMRGQSFKSILHVFEIYSKIICWLISWSILKVKLVRSTTWLKLIIHNLLSEEHSNYFSYIDTRRGIVVPQENHLSCILN